MIKGSKMTIQQREKLSWAHRNHKPTDEARKKISLSLLGNTRCIGRIPWNKGRKDLGGYKWSKPTKTPEILLARLTTKYKLWRLAVYERDNFTCQMCGQVGGILNADHINSFAHYPEQRYELSNGRTLCHSCHKTTPNYGRKNKIESQAPALAP